MLIRNNKKFLNLQEAVEENKELAETAAKYKGMFGPYATVEAIPEEVIKENYLILVGPDNPYFLYKVQTTDGETRLVSLGQYPKSGPVGPTGPEGPRGLQGETGVTGATGPQGPAGQDGADGQDGQDGQDGAAAGFGTPTATATGLAAGSSPTVTVTGSGPDTAKVFSFAFGIPKGDKGDTGERGPAGPAIPDWDSLQEQAIVNQYTYSNDSTQYFGTSDHLLVQYTKPYDAPAEGGGTYSTTEKSYIQALNNEIDIVNFIGNGSEDYNMYAGFKIEDGVASYSSQVRKVQEGILPGRIEITFPTSEDLMDYPTMAKSSGRIATTADAGYVTYWKLGANDSMPNYIYATDTATHTMISDDFKTAFGSDRAAFVVEKTISGSAADVETKVYRKIGRYKDASTGQSKHYFQSISRYNNYSTSINVDIMIIDDTPITDPEHPSILYNYYAVTYASKTIPLGTLPTKTSDLTNDSKFYSTNNNMSLVGKSIVIRNSLNNIYANISNTEVSVRDNSVTPNVYTGLTANYVYASDGAQSASITPYKIMVNDITNQKFMHLIFPTNTDSGTLYKTLATTDQITNTIPECPSTTDGTYVLEATVSSGVVTYNWVLKS